MHCSAIPFALCRAGCVFQNQAPNTWLMRPQLYETAWMTTAMTATTTVRWRRSGEQG